MTPSVVGETLPTGAPCGGAPSGDFLTVLAAAVGDASTADPAGASITLGEELEPVGPPVVPTAGHTAPDDPAPAEPASSVAPSGTARATDAGLPLPAGCSCCAAPSAPSSPTGPGRAESAASWERGGAVSAPLAPRVAGGRYSADVVGPPAPAAPEASSVPDSRPGQDAPEPGSAHRPDAALAAPLPPSFDRPPFSGGAPGPAGWRGPSRPAGRPVDHTIARPPLATGDAPVATAAAQAAAASPSPPARAVASVTRTAAPSTGFAADRPVAARPVPGTVVERVIPRSPRVASDDDATGTGDTVAGDPGTGDAANDPVAPPSSLPTAAAPARADATASSPRPAMPASLGMVGTERVENVRRLQGTQPLQRLSVDLDDAKVAVRVRGGRLSVDVVSDPQGVLGDGWARQVERTLDQAVRLQEPAARHDVARSPTADQGTSRGAGQPDRQQPHPDDDERRQRRQFVWDMEEER